MHGEPLARRLAAGPAQALGHRAAAKRTLCSAELTMPLASAFAQLAAGVGHYRSVGIRALRWAWSWSGGVHSWRARTNLGPHICDVVEVTNIAEHFWDKVSSKGMAAPPCCFGAMSVRSLGLALWMLVATVTYALCAGLTWLATWQGRYILRAIRCVNRLCAHWCVAPPQQIGAVVISVVQRASGSTASVGEVSTSFRDSSIMLEDHSLVVWKT